MADMKFSCPHCQQHISADAGYAGLQINCPSCNGSLIVPADPAVSAPASAPAPAPARLSIRSSASAAAPPPLSGAAPAAAGSGCPSCGVALPRGAVLCTHCGYNLVTRQRTVAGRPAALGKPRAPSGDAPWYKTAYPYLGVVVLLLGIFYLLGRSNPVFFLGFLVVALLYMLTTSILVLVAAFREGVGTGFLTLCLPFYAFYFVFKVNENDTLKILYGFNVLLGLSFRLLSIGDK